MNAVEIEQAVSDLAERRSTRPSFPSPSSRPSATRRPPSSGCAAGDSNKSDSRRRASDQQHPHRRRRAGEVTETLAALKASPATAKAKAKFVLATDGETFEAEDLESGETVACDYADLPDHFGFFLPLAGITTVRQIARTPSTSARRAGSTGSISSCCRTTRTGTRRAPARHEPLHGAADLLLLRRRHRHLPRHGLFTDTIAQMSERDSSNTHEVIGELFRAMNTRTEDHGRRGLAALGEPFPYVNGGLFSGTIGRAALQPDRALLPAAHRRPRLDAGSTRTSSAR